MQSAESGHIYRHMQEEHGGANGGEAALLEAANVSHLTRSIWTGCWDRSRITVAGSFKREWAYWKSESVSGFFGIDFGALVTVVSICRFQQAAADAGETEDERQERIRRQQVRCFREDVWKVCEMCGKCGEMCGKCLKSV